MNRVRPRDRIRDPGIRREEIEPFREAFQPDHFDAAQCGEPLPIEPEVERQHLALYALTCKEPAQLKGTLSGATTAHGVECGVDAQDFHGAAARASCRRYHAANSASPRLSATGLLN